MFVVDNGNKEGRLPFFFSPLWNETSLQVSDTSLDCQDMSYQAEAAATPAGQDSKVVRTVSHSDGHSLTPPLGRIYRVQSTPATTEYRLQTARAQRRKFLLNFTEL